MSPISLLCNEEEQTGSRWLHPGGCWGAGKQGPVAAGSGQRGQPASSLCLLIDRVEYSTVQAEPNYLAWKTKLESTAAKLSLCHQEGD